MHGEGNKCDAVDSFGTGDETPRKGFRVPILDLDRERDREFLEALRFVFHNYDGELLLKSDNTRSPNVGSPGARASVCGRGLGGGIKDSGKATEEDDEDETLDWDQAQVCFRIT
jgi:hypothetical protein